MLFLTKTENPKGALVERYKRSAYESTSARRSFFVSNYDRLTAKLNVENFIQAINLNIDKDLKMLLQEQLKIINNTLQSANPIYVMPLNILDKGHYTIQHMIF